MTDTPPSLGASDPPAQESETLKLGESATLENEKPLRMEEESIRNVDETPPIQQLGDVAPLGGGPTRNVSIANGDTMDLKTKDIGLSSLALAEGAALTHDAEKDDSAEEIVFFSDEAAESKTLDPEAANEETPVLQRQDTDSNDTRPSTMDTEGESVRFLLNSTKSMIQQELQKQSTLSSMFHLSNDTYSFFLTCKIGTPPFLIAVFVFALQMTLYGLAFASATDFGSGSSNPLRIPANVEASVTTAQFLSLGIAILVQDSLRECLFIVENYGILLENIPGNTPLKLLACFTFKLSESVLSLVVILVLICQQEDVVDLLMNFAALLFVSTLDNIVFAVGREGYLGSRFKTAVSEVEDIRFFTSGRKKRKLILRTSVISVIYTSLLISWIILCPVRQSKGYYLSDRAIVQFPGGSSDPTLQLFTGVYELDKSRSKDRRLMYVEANIASRVNRMESNGGRSLKAQESNSRGERFPAFFSYCKTLKAWVFVAGGETGSASPCTNYKAISATYLGYDLLATASGAWYLNDANKEPIQNVFLQKLDTATDDPSRFGLKNEFDLPCPELQLDELKGALASTRQFSSTYSLLQDGDGDTVEVHTRPVFVNPDTLDLILYTGSVWVLTGAAFLHDFDSSSSNSLSDYLSNDFHAYWSRYDAFLVTETIVFSSEKDSATPDGLDWFFFDSLDGEADKTRQVDAILLCSVCDDKKNPCFYEGSCQDGFCNCTRGSSGVLCQVPPTSNGRCDSFFNNLAFDWDGGDCCKSTCRSTSDHTCGYDGSGLFYLDFLQCRDPDVYDCSSPGASNLCWSLAAEQVFGETNNAETGYAVSATESMLVVGEPGADSVRVLDRYGSEFRFRDLLPNSGLAGARFGSSVSVATHEKIHASAMRSTKPIVAATAASGQGMLKVFQWSHELGSWDDISPNFEAADYSDPSHLAVHLYHSGKVLAAFEHHWARFLGKVTIWGWNTTNLGWTEKATFACDCSDFALSHDARIMVAANRDDHSASLFLYNEKQGTYQEHGSLDLHGMPMSIKLTENGKTLAALGYTDGDTYRTELCLYDQTNETSYLKRQGECIRVLEISSTLKDTIELNEDGSLVTLVNRDGGIVTSYQQNQQGFWDRFGETIEGSAAQILGDSLTEIIVGNPADDAAGSNRGVVSVYARKPNYCKEDEAFVGVSIHFDDSPEETWWQLIDTNTGSVVMQQGPFESVDAFMISSHGTCVRKDQCVALHVFDTKGDGISSPGGYLVQRDGLPMGRREFSGGLLSTMFIESTWNCPNSLSNPSFLGTHFKQCLHETCDWEQAGLEIVGASDGDLFGTTTSLSNNGQLLVSSAKGDSGLGDGRGSVHAFSQDPNGNWIPLGHTLAGDQDDQHFGQAMKSARNASIVVVGTPASGTEVYEFKHSEWSKKGQTILGPDNSHPLGTSVAINDDGSVIAASSANGLVQAFHWNEDTLAWTKFGQDLQCEPVWTHDGSLVLSNSGKILGFSCPDEADLAGRIKVYKFDDKQNAFLQLGQFLEGDTNADAWWDENFTRLGSRSVRLSPNSVVALDDFFGDAISLSADGHTIAAGSIAHGYTRVWAFEGGRWIPQGDKIEFGGIVSLSGDGRMIALGSPYADPDPEMRLQTQSYGAGICVGGVCLGSPASGSAGVFFFVSPIGQWHQLGKETLGYSLSFLGGSVSLANDGLRFSVGELSFSRAPNVDNGQVLVMDFQPVSKYLQNAGSAGSSTCDPGYSELEVEIAMDEFPEDISYEIFDFRAEKTAAVSFESSSAFDTIAQTYCVDSALFPRFDIHDRFHNGLCCGSGEGHYKLLLDGNLIHLGGNFSELETNCITEQSVPIDIGLFTPGTSFDSIKRRKEWLEYFNRDWPKQEIWRDTSTMNAGIQIFGSAPSGDFSSVKQNCVPSDFCNVYTVNDDGSHPLYFNVSYNEHMKLRDAPVNNFESYWFPGCKDNLCPDDSIVKITIKELGRGDDQGTVDYQNQWSVRDSKRETMWQLGTSTQPRETENHWVCVPEGSCITFSLEWDIVNQLSYLNGYSGIQTWVGGEAHNATYLKDWNGAFSIWLDEQKVVDMRDRIRHPKTYQFGSCYTTCDDGHALFSLHASVGLNPSLVWSIFNSNNSVVVSHGFSEGDSNTTYVYNTCFPLEETFFFSTLGNHVDIEISWNGLPVDLGWNGLASFGKTLTGCGSGILQMNSHVWFPASIFFEDCEQVTCDDGYGLLHVQATTATDPSLSSWNIFGSADSAGPTPLLTQGFSASDGNKVIQYHFCLPLGSYYFTHKGSQSAVEFDLSWEGSAVNIERGFGILSTTPTCGSDLLPFSLVISPAKHWSRSTTWKLSKASEHDSLFAAGGYDRSETALIFHHSLCIPEDSLCHTIDWDTGGSNEDPEGQWQVAFGGKVYSWRDISSGMCLGREGFSTKHFSFSMDGFILMNTETARTINDHVASIGDTHDASFASSCNCCPLGCHYETVTFTITGMHYGGIHEVNLGTAESGEFGQTDLPPGYPSHVSATDNYMVIVESFVVIPKGIWSIGVSAQDGHYTKLEDIEFTHCAGVADYCSVGGDEIGKRFPWQPEKASIGVFMVDEPTEAKLTSLFYDTWTANESFEIAIAAGNATSFRPSSGFQILADGVLGWEVVHGCGLCMPELQVHGGHH